MKIDGRRNLAYATVEDAQESYDLGHYMQFELRRGDEDSSPVDQLNFQVRVDQTENDELYMNVQFENPQAVSIGQTKDLLVGEVMDPTFFSRLDDSTEIKKGTQIELWIPKQLSGDELEQFATDFHDGVNSIAQALVFSNLVFTIILAVSLKAMWNFHNVMQVLAYLKFFTDWPVIVDQILSQIFDAITLKPLIMPMLEYGRDRFEIFSETVTNEMLR